MLLHGAVEGSVNKERMREEHDSEQGCPARRWHRNIQRRAVSELLARQCPSDGEVWKHMLTEKGAIRIQGQRPVT